MSKKNRPPHDETARAAAHIGPAPAEPRKAERAFVIHAQLIEGGDRMRGRVEHVVSGRAGRFSDVDALVEFVRRISARRTLEDS